MVRKLAPANFAIVKVNEFAERIPLGAAERGAEGRKEHIRCPLERSMGPGGSPPTPLSRADLGAPEAVATGATPPGLIRPDRIWRSEE